MVFTAWYSGPGDGVSSRNPLLGVRLLPVLAGAFCACALSFPFLPLDFDNVPSGSDANMPLAGRQSVFLLPSASETGFSIAWRGVRTYAPTKRLKSLSWACIHRNSDEFDQRLGILLGFIRGRMKGMIHGIRKTRPESLALHIERSSGSDWRFACVDLSLFRGRRDRSGLSALCKAVRRPSIEMLSEDGCVGHNLAV